MVRITSALFLAAFIFFTTSCGKSTPEICVVAEKCCNDAMAELGASCNYEEELGNPRRSDYCEGFMKGIKKVLADERKPLPESCR